MFSGPQSSTFLVMKALRAKPVELSLNFLGSFCGWEKEALLHLQCTPELGGVPGYGSWNSMVSCPFQVGHGTRVLNESIIVEWTVPKQLEVKYIGFSTGWGSMGEFKIWRKEETDENHNEAFTLGVPHNIIPGSERATASIIGIKYQEVSLRYPLSNVNRCSSCYF